MSQSPKFLKIDNRLGRRKFKSEQQMSDEDDQSLNQCNCIIQQESEIQTKLTNKYNKNKINFKIETERQGCRQENYNNLSSRDASSRNTQQNNLYSYRIPLVIDLDEDSVRKKKKQQIKGQIKSMREMLHQLNNQLTRRLNKYQITNLTPKGTTLALQTQKQYQILLAILQNNIKLIEIQERQIAQVQAREKEVSQKDYQSKLQQQLFQVEKAIRQKKKQKELEGNIVGKLDYRLTDTKDTILQDQFKQIKSMKHNIFYYQKKSRENKAILKQTEKNYEAMIERDRILTIKLNKYSKIAQETNMAVITNKNYMTNKKVRDELGVKKDYLRKKIDVTKRSKQQQAQKLQKQIQMLRKQINFVDKKYQLVFSNCIQTIKKTEQLMQKNKIDLKLISKISYKLSQPTVKNSKQRSLNQSLQPLEQVQTDVQQKKLQSRLKIKVSALSSPKGKTIIPTSRYQTLGVEQLQGNRQRNIIKYTEALNLSKSRDKQFRIKPNLHMRRNNKSSIEQTSQAQTNDLQRNLRPRKLHKLLIKKDKEKQII